MSDNLPVKQRVISPLYKYLDYDRMKVVCLSSIDAFKAVATQFGEGDQRYFFRDLGSDILAVAHLDTVQSVKHFEISTEIAKDGVEHEFILNAQLDDRLGAYVILDLLRKLGCKYDILLTEGEETGRSTGDLFEVPEGKNYKWMFQFDRMGHDVVMYQYDNAQTRKAVTDAGLTPAIGSFSDIATMGHVKCMGFNFGVGYHDNHATKAWADVDEMLHQVEGFVRFYAQNKDVAMPYTGPKHKSHVVTYSGSRTWDDWNHFDYTGHTTTTYGWNCQNCAGDCFKNADDKAMYTQWGLCVACADIIKPEELETIEFGDYVEVLSGAWKGHIARVVHSTKKNVDVQLYNKSGYVITVWLKRIQVDLLPDELVAESERINVVTFKVGDIVRHKSRSGYSRRETGEVTAILSGDRYPIQVKWLQGITYMQRYGRDELELVDDSDMDDPTKPLPIYKVGDKLRNKNSLRVATITAYDTEHGDYTLKYRGGMEITLRSLDHYRPLSEEVEEDDEFPFSIGDHVRFKNAPREVGSIVRIAGEAVTVEWRNGGVSLTSASVLAPHYDFKINQKVRSSDFKYQANGQITAIYPNHRYGVRWDSSKWDIYQEWELIPSSSETDKEDASND